MLKRSAAFNPACCGVTVSPLRAGQPHTPLRRKLKLGAKDTCPGSPNYLTPVLRPPILFSVSHTLGQNTVPVEFGGGQLRPRHNHTRNRFPLKMVMSQVLLGMTVERPWDVQFHTDKELLMPRQTHVPMTVFPHVLPAQGTGVSKRHLRRQSSHLSSQAAQ